MRPLAMGQVADRLHDVILSWIYYFISPKLLGELARRRLERRRELRHVGVRGLVRLVHLGAQRRRPLLDALAQRHRERAEHLRRQLRVVLQHAQHLRLLELDDRHRRLGDDRHAGLRAEEEGHLAEQLAHAAPRQFFGSSF